jgi:hypothetical protein
MFLTDYNAILKNMPSVKGSYFLPYMPHHLDELDCIEMKTQKAISIPEFKRMVNHQAECGPTITAFLYNKPVAIYGATMLWKGVAEFWSLLSEQSRRYPIAMTKSGLTFIDIVEILFHLHRVQITVKTSDTRAMLWAKALGFVPECNMLRYSADKDDYTLFRRQKWVDY